MSPLIAKSSDDTGHQPPRTGTRGAMAARFVRRTPVYTSSPASSRSRSLWALAATRPAAIGTTSAVVLPTSMSSASGCVSATASAVATQLAAATSHGRALAALTDTSSPAVVRTLSSPSASWAASRTNSTPSRFVRKASESSAVIVIAIAGAGPAATSAATSRSTAASASRLRQTSNGRETVRSPSPSSQAAFVFAPPMSTASVAAAVPGMRVVGVIDLKDGTAVHAVRGERERYRPATSVIGGEDGDALALARGFREELGLGELYVADLDAIAARSGRDNAALLRELAREAHVMVDAGVSDPAAARELLGLGAHRVIVGTETLPGSVALARLLAELPEGTVIVSVDLREGRLLSPDAELAGLPALDAMRRLPSIREAIVLDLARVGSGAGPDVALIAEVHAAFPDLELLAGGGVRDVDDLRALEAAGAAGALVATALHRGVIGSRELAALR